MKKCNTYPPETISRFMDNALSGNATADLEKHLKTCPECRHLLQQYLRLEDGLSHIIRQKAPSEDTADLEGILIRQIRDKNRKNTSVKSSFRQFLDFIQGKKFYLQMASFAAILLLSTMFLRDQEKFISSPSAIVNSIDGNMASVMILETREERHTIIWYKET